VAPRLEAPAAQFAPKPDPHPAPSELRNPATISVASLTPIQTPRELSVET
jgi:hypothetical protein